MAILVMGTIKLAAGEGDKAREILAQHMRDVAAEDGCELYAFSQDVADPDLIRVTERWASPEALAAHGQAEHQKAFGRKLREHQPQAMNIKAWDGEFWRTLIGD